MLRGATRILRTLFVTLASKQPCMGWCLLQMKLQRRGESTLNYYFSTSAIRSIGGTAGIDEGINKGPRYRLSTTGGLRNLPIIQPADELLVGRPRNRMEFEQNTTSVRIYPPYTSILQAGAVKRSMRITPDVEVGIFHLTFLPLGVFAPESFLMNHYSLLF